MPCRVFVVFVATFVLPAAASGQALLGPRDLLATLPAETALTVLPIEGTLRPGSGVTGWRLYVNDAKVFEAGLDAARGQAAVSLGLILRRGDNLLTIESLGSAERPIERWTTHVHRVPAVGARQFALLVQGQSTARDVSGQIDRIKRTLLAYNLPDSNIVVASSWDEAVASISRLARQSSGRDQILIYYAGAGRLNSRTGEPDLFFAGASPGLVPWPAGNLIREAVDFSSVSVLLDVAYLKESLSSAMVSFSAQQAASSAAPWLRTIADANVEIAYTNPSFGADARGFTDDFIDALATEPAPDGCRGFAQVAQGVAARNAPRQQTAWPLVYAKTPTSFRFCSRRNTLALAVTGAPSLDATPELRFIDLRLPAAARNPQVNIDGVAVTQPAPLSNLPGGTLRLPVGPGRHLVEVIEPGGDVPAVGAVTGGITTAMATSKWSAELTSQIQRTVPDVTTEALVALPFVIGDRADSQIRYEVRNNGVVVAHDRVATSGAASRRQIVKRIPMLVGVNNIVVDVTRGDRLASSSVTVIRRPAQPVRALIVGVPAPAGAPALQGTDADVRRMRDVLLRHTDAKLADIDILTGAAATRTAILDAIAVQGRRAAAVVPEETFVFYFSGYGLSVGEADTVVRCLVPADFVPGRERETCLLTTDIDAALDAVGRAVVIVDTSYDGGAGPGSRTYRTFSTADASWRLTSGTDRPDRTFLVASGSNAPAMESADGGFFTAAFDAAIVGQLHENDASTRSDLPLLEAFERARDDTSRRTDKRQVPIMKGVLAAPFAFVSRSTASLQQEAASIERAGRSDVVSMRRVTTARLAWAVSLYDKVLALTPLDLEARLGRTRVLMLQSDSAAADVMLAETEPLLETKSKERGQWLMLRAVQRMRAGDIKGAVTDAEASISLDPENLVARAQLGMLYAADGDLRKALDQLVPLVSQPDVNGALSDDEFSRVLLHAAVISVAVSDSARALFMLRLFVEPGNNVNLLTPFVLLQRALDIVKWPLVPARGRESVRPPWPILVAQFIRDDDKYETAMLEFQRDSEAYDPLDASAFTCVANFYVGMVRLGDNRQDDARAAFQRVIDSGRTEYPEYWMAKAQIEGMR